MIAMTLPSLFLQPEYQGRRKGSRKAGERLMLKGENPLNANVGHDFQLDQGYEVSRTERRISPWKSTAWRTLSLL